MKYELIRKGALYDMLCKISGKPKGTIVMFFYRKRLKIEDGRDFFNYAKSNEQKGANKISDK